MVGRLWFQPPRRVLTSFLVVIVVCVAALAWLGYRLLDQDRALESQRLREQLEAAADVTAAALERKLSELERLLIAAPGDASLPDGTLLVVAGAEDVELYGGRPSALLPGVRHAAGTAGRGAPQGRSRRVSEERSPGSRGLVPGRRAVEEPGVRAAALVRLGRSLRKAGRIREALNAYSELAALGSTLVSGLPAELVAREARCSALEAAGQRDELRREATALLERPRDGPVAPDAQRLRVPRGRGAPVDRQRGRTAATVRGAGAVRDRRRTLVEAVARAARSRRADGERTSATPRPTLVVWRADADRLTAVVAGPQLVASLGSEALSDPRMRLALTDADGQVVLGDCRRRQSARR